MIVRVDRTGLLVTRTPETVAAYRERYRRLAVQAGVDRENLEGVIQWFIGEHNRWAPSTISQYTATLIQAIEDAGESAANLLTFRDWRPRPRVSGPPQTSARKRKSVPKLEFVRLLDFLRLSHHPDDRLVAQWLNHNVRLFLRPSEWLTATIEKTQLVVENGKATNGRAHGTHRHVELQGYGHHLVRDLAALLVVLKDRASKAKSLKHLWGSLAARIARACKKIHIKRVSLYTMRHVGVANAKCRMSPEEVSALAGHKTTATATTHYAKRRTGWRIQLSGVARPSAEDVAKVVRSEKVSRELNLEFIRKRAELKEEDRPSFGL